MRTTVLSTERLVVLAFGVVGTVVLLPLDESLSTKTSDVTSAAMATAAAIALMSQWPETDRRTEVTSVLMVPSP